MNELWEYPFRAGVWGTASDWTMVVVTAFTLLYLILTLKSQRDVQKLQLKVTRIENERFIKEQKLKFDAQAEFRTNYQSDPIEIEIDLTLTMLNGDSESFYLLPKPSNCELILDTNNIYAMDNISQGSKDLLKMKAIIEKSIYLDDKAIIEINLLFSDRVLNTFQQNVTIEISMGGFLVSVDEAAELLTT